MSKREQIIKEMNRLKETWYWLKFNKQTEYLTPKGEKLIQETKAAYIKYKEQLEELDRKNNEIKAP